MASGFFALLDDVAGIAKLAAASIDDIGATAGRVGLKAAGVVVDDTAVTPRYVAGFKPERELPMIGRITLGSLRNKLVIVLPAALLLNAVVPWAVTPLLMLGGGFLCFEGAEKVIEAMLGHEGHGARDAAETDGTLLEDAKVRGAIRTDLILSAEIMAIALAEVADEPLVVEVAVLVFVAIAVTLGVYGVVALVVKADDLGLHLARGSVAPLRFFGRGLVQAMPPLLLGLSVVGTAAMLWVGGGILLHGLALFGAEAPAHAIEGAADAVARLIGPLEGLVAWSVSVAGAGCVGFATGALLVGVVTGVGRWWPGRK